MFREADYTGLPPLLGNTPFGLRLCYLAGVSLLHRMPRLGHHAGSACVYTSEAHMLAVQHESIAIDSIRWPTDDLRMGGQGIGNKQ